MNYQELEAKVLEWAGEKGILEKATPLAQANKTLEEVEELFKKHKLNQESKFSGPLFDNEMWGKIKKNGHLISIKTEADREGRSAAG